MVRRVSRYGQPMQIGVPRERTNKERRVGAVPASVKVFVDWGWDVHVESDAGTAAGYTDASYIAAGASIVASTAEAHNAQLVIRVGPPTPDEIALIPEGAILTSLLNPFVDTDLIALCNARKISSVAMEAVPRTTLAQAMDALSSQATAAGYAAVLMAATKSPKLIPMLVTAAGTIKPSRALILGVGVAGLQAIATAKRLGAQVHAYDVRPETREQVESLGARFVEAPTQSGDDGGYAKEVDDETAAKQQAILADYVAQSNMVITTAQIPGRAAPRLINADVVERMAPGSVIIDMAAKSGGNVEGSVVDEVVEVNGVRIYGPSDLASRVATDASAMYARNVQELVNRMRPTDDDAPNEASIRLDDEVVGPCVISHNGAIVNERTRSVMGLEPLAIAAPPPTEEPISGSEESA